MSNDDIEHLKKNEQFLEKFINIYRSYEQLWNKAHENWYKSKKREDYISAIALKVNISPAQVKVLWKFLSNKFNREWANFKKYQLSGSSASAAYKSNWALYDSLTFLIPCRTPGKTFGNLEELFLDNSFEVEMSQKKNEKVSSQSKEVEKKKKNNNKIINLINILKEEVNEINPTKKLAFKRKVLGVTEEYQNKSKALKEMEEKKVEPKRKKFDTPMKESPAKQGEHQSVSLEGLAGGSCSQQQLLMLGQQMQLMQSATAAFQHICMMSAPGTHWGSSRSFPMPMSTPMPTSNSRGWRSRTPFVTRRQSLKGERSGSTKTKENVSKQIFKIEDINWNFINCTKKPKLTLEEDDIEIVEEPMEIIDLDEYEYEEEI